MQNLFLLSLFSISLNTAAAGTPEKIMLYSYHNHPPFVTAKNQGLTYDLAEQLNTLAAGRYNFEVKIVPRSRLNYFISGWINGKCPNIECDNNWLVPWVNPKWGFSTTNANNYLWHPLFIDSNVIVSNTSNHFEYTGPESLKGGVLAGMRGHSYVGIDELVNSGEVTRIDGNRERDNLLKVLKNRVTATLLPRSTMQYFLKEDSEIKKQKNQLKVSKKVHQQYQRFIMLPSGREKVLSLLQSVPVATLINTVAQ